MSAKFYDDLKVLMPKGCSFNYGYYSQPFENKVLEFRRKYLDFDYELYAINLYDTITRNLILTNQTGLDFSCGRASGSAYLAYSKAPKLIYATDQSRGNIEFAESKFSDLQNLKLEVGSVENIDYPDSQLNFVLNVHSFRLYDDTKAAFTELLRVLKPGGDLIIADQFTQLQIDSLTHSINTKNAFLVEERNLTKGIMESMALTQTEKRELISQFAYDEGTRNFALEWGGLPESQVFREFQNNQSYFNMYHIRKKI